MLEVDGNSMLVCSEHGVLLFGAPSLRRCSAESESRECQGRGQAPFTLGALQVPLADESVDIAVFCLALMGTNLQEILEEANRVLKQG